MREGPGTSGFTVVELLITLAIVTILAIIAGFSHKSFTARSMVERQIKMMYSDIIDVRQKALLEKRSRTIELTRTTFRLFSSELAKGTPASQRNLAYPVIWNRRASRMQVSFDTWGCTEDMVSICIDDSHADAASVNCIVISKYKVRMGVRRGGYACTSENIVLK